MLDNSDCLRPLSECFFLPSKNLAIYLWVYSYHLQPFVSLVQYLERTVQTVKNVLQKCKESGQDPHLASFVFVAPHCLMTYHRLPSLWMAGCIRQTFQQSPSFPPLLMETVALVKYSEEIAATYEVLTNPLNSQFLQIKSLRTFQLLTHILKSSLPAVPLRHWQC